MTKYRFLLFFSFFLLILPRGNADVLDDYEVELARTAQTGNYKSALKAPESSFAKEYAKNLQHLILLGKDLDKSVNAALPGNIFAFHDLSREIAAIYKFNSEKMRHPENYRKKQSKKNKSNRQNKQKKDLKNILLDPVPIFKLLQADIKSLRKIGFTEAEGPRITGQNLLTKDLLSFRHALTTFTTFRQPYFRKKTPPVFRKELDKRFTSLGFAARKLQDSIQKYSDGAASLEYNIAKETAFMLRTFEKYRKLALDGRSGGGKDSIATYEREIRSSLQKINSSLSSISKSGLGGSSVSPKLLPGKKSASTYQDLSREALEKELLKRRVKIYRSNTVMDGFDKIALRKYLLSLTKEERADFEKLRKERLESGSDMDSATRTAILAIHSQNKISANKKELISLLQKLDKEEQKEWNKR